MVTGAVTAVRVPTPSTTFCPNLAVGPTVGRTWLLVAFGATTPRATRLPAEMGWELQITPKMPTGLIWTVRGVEKEDPQWEPFLGLQRQAA